MPRKYPNQVPRNMPTKVPNQPSYHASRYITIEIPSVYPTGDPKAILI